jgi:hypothetical protein
MVRLSIVALTLVCVSLIGLTIPPMEDLAYISHNLLEPLGINPSFTPITVDMSMMTSNQGHNNFDREIQYLVKTVSGKKPITPSTLNLYLDKIPMILFLEQAYDMVDLVEARYGICQRLKQLTGEKVESFSLETARKHHRANIFNRDYSCVFP